jgi:hypothetical protein
MNEFLGIDPNIPIFHLLPLVVFGPFFLYILYNLGLKEIINPSPETRELRRLAKQEKDRKKAEEHKKMEAAGLKIIIVKKTPLQLLGQGLTFALFALVIGYLSNSPAYVAHPPENALLRLSFTHAGKHIEKCRKRTREELAKLAANMRAPMSCSRERWPVITELSLDGKKIYQGVSSPAGFSKDGHSSFYQGFPIAAGRHRITVGVWDSRGEAGPVQYDYVLDRQVNLRPKEILVISFDNGAGGITLQ